MKQVIGTSVNGYKAASVSHT